MADDHLWNEKVTIIPDNTKIKAQGTFDLMDFYLELHRWFDHNGFNWYERQFRQLDNGGSLQIEMWWECEKPVDDYTKYLIILNIQCFVKKVPVEQTGQSNYQGIVEFRTGAKILRKAATFGDWKNKSLPKMKKKIYDKIIARERFEQQEEELYVLANRLYDEIKAFLALAK